MEALIPTLMITFRFRYYVLFINNANACNPLRIMENCLWDFKIPNQIETSVKCCCRSNSFLWESSKVNWYQEKICLRIHKCTEAEFSSFSSSRAKSAPNIFWRKQGLFSSQLVTIGQFVTHLSLCGDDRYKRHRTADESKQLTRTCHGQGWLVDNHLIDTL